MNDLAHRVRKVTYSIFDVVYKMSVLENRMGKELLSMRLIQRGADGESAAIQNVGVDLSGLDIFVAEEFLHGADVVSRFEQMSGKGVAQGMWPNGFSKADAVCGHANGFLEGTFVQMVAS